jgi:hypothetical protein
LLDLLLPQKGPVPFSKHRHRCFAGPETRQFGLPPQAAQTPFDLSINQLTVELHSNLPGQRSGLLERG